MKKTILAAALGVALSAGGAAAQSAVPVELELRVGAALPQGDIEDGLGTGYTWGINGAYGFNEKLQGYLSYSQAVYGPEEDIDEDVDIKDKGLGAGLRYTIPTAGRIRPWFSAGLAYRSFEVDADGGNISLDSELGFEAGAGIAFDVSPRVSLTPGIGYTSVSLDGDDGEGGEFSADMSSLRIDVGVRVRL